MQHPFRIGGKYRNRIGEYEVVELDEPRMVIRYADGQVLETTVEMQARIWQNIQIEERARPGPEPTSPSPPPPPRPSSPPDRRGHKFRGLQGHDFQQGVGGTTWRARQSLGGKLAQRMTDVSGSFFQSYAVYRRAEVHIVRPDRYVEAKRLQKAKFIFRLNEARASFGFYIEKNKGPMDATWDWLSFVEALENNTVLQERVQTAMDQLQLHWDIVLWVDHVRVAHRVELVGGTLKWKTENQEEPEVIAWSTFVERLKMIDVATWCDLYLLASLGKEQAVAAGIDVAQPVVAVYQSLLPLYEASTKTALSWAELPRSPSGHVTNLRTGDIQAPGLGTSTQ